MWCLYIAIVCLGIAKASVFENNISVTGMSLFSFIYYIAKYGTVEL